jgi:hypothetical protein
MWSLTAFCTFSKARTSICLTRSRETPNSFASLRASGFWCGSAPAVSGPDPVAQRRRQRRPPLRPADRASHRHRENKIGDRAAPARDRGSLRALLSEVTTRPEPCS